MTSPKTQRRPPATELPLLDRLRESREPHPCDLYQELRALYDTCNTVFFDGTLPNAMILLRPRRGLFGSYQHACWGPATFLKGAERVAALEAPDTLPEVKDAIVLNSLVFLSDGEEEVVSTLVHEMTHLWQQHFGEKVPQKPYHNREWALKMTAHGLIPSTTGKPGGKQTGTKVAEYRLDSGKFSQWYAQSAKPLLSWIEIPKLKLVKRQPPKYKYVCPHCEAKAWALEGAKLACRLCSNEPMLMVPRQVTITDGATG